MKEFRIIKGTSKDIVAISKLYDHINDYLETHINYPGWEKGIYPTYEVADQGIQEEMLFMYQTGEEIAGTVILNHRQEPAYKQAKWLVEAEDEEVLVVHTFAVNPDFLGLGIGLELLEFAKVHGKDRNLKTIRLDVYNGNIPAIGLYKKAGFQYIDTVDLGLGDRGLHEFQLYEFPLKG